MGGLLNHSPGLAGVRVEIAGLVQATQDAVGQVADIGGQGHIRQPGSLRRVWIPAASPARPKLTTATAGLPSSEIASESSR